jgi:hypothetical protein
MVVQSVKIGQPFSWLKGYLVIWLFGYFFVFSHLSVTLTTSNLLTFDNKSEKNFFFLLYCAHLIVTLTTSNLLTFDNKSEKNFFSLCIVLT